MTHQYHPQHDLPRIAGSGTHTSTEYHKQTYKDEESFFDRVNKYWWPVAVCFIVAFNVSFCFNALLLMYQASVYSAYNYLTAVGIFCFSIGMLLIIYTYAEAIKKRHDVRYDD